MRIVLNEIENKLELHLEDPDEASGVAAALRLYSGRLLPNSGYWAGELEETAKDLAARRSPRRREAVLLASQRRAMRK